MEASQEEGYELPIIKISGRSLKQDQCMWARARAILKREMVNKSSSENRGW